MARRREIPLGLSPLDELFTVQSERDDAEAERVVEVRLADLDPFPGHPYQVRDDEEMAALSESIRQHGVLTPLLARPAAEGRYEIVSGHRRKRAAEMAGLHTVPAVVRELGRDEAVVAMVNSNMQRERVLPSEKAFAYRMKMEAMSRQGWRSDITCAPVGHKSPGQKSRDVLAQESGDSKSQVQRYIRLTELVKPLLDLVDSGQMSMRPAVELSYLSARQQSWVADALGAQACTPSHAQALRMRRLAEEGELEAADVARIMAEEKANQVAKLHIPASRLSKYFRPGTSRREMEDRIIRGLELLQRQERNRGMER